MRKAPLLTACLLLAWAPARAKIQTIELAPPATQVDFTTYAMGMFPLAGHFTRFTGTLQVDLAHPAGCTVSLDVDVASLWMGEPGRVRLALGPKLLDAAAFPHMIFHGGCAGHESSGQLALHGTTRTLSLTASREGNRVTATTSLHRGDYGITGLPGLIGRTIKIAFTVSLPPEIARLADQ